jgi:hypothetical protein
MNQQGEGGGLLSILMGLYHQLVSEINTLRIKTYQPTPRGPASADLVDRLHGYIASRPPPGDANLSAIIHANKVSMVTRLDPQRYADMPAGAARPNALSQSLSERHTTAILRNTTGNKLIQSIWDHLHSSIRSAKAGDAETARLHAGIMDNALREAANYVSEEEYQELVQSLGNELSGLTLSPGRKTDQNGA